MCKCSPYNQNYVYCYKCFPVVREEMIEEHKENLKNSVEFSREENLIMRDLLLRETTRQIESEVGILKLVTPIYLALIKKLEKIADGK